MKLSVFDISVDHTKETWLKLQELLKEKKTISYSTVHKRKDGALQPATVHLQYLKTKDEHYEFAFVCDAKTCPLVTNHEPAPCGFIALPTIKELLLT